MLSCYIREQAVLAALIGQQSYSILFLSVKLLFSKAGIDLMREKPIRSPHPSICRYFSARRNSITSDFRLSGIINSLKSLFEAPLSRQRALH